MAWGPFLVVVIYLTITFGIGKYISKKSAAGKSTRSLFVAQGSLSAGLIVALLFGEMIAGSSTVGSSATAFGSGYSAVWVNWGMSLGTILFSLTVMKFYRQAGYYGAMTVPEAINFRFGSKSRYVMVVVILVVYSILWAMQPVAAASLLSPMIGVNKTLITWIVGGLFIIMALIGIKGLAMMNIIHSCIMVFGLALVSFTAVHKVGGLGEMLSQIPSTYTDFLYPDVSSIVSTALGTMLGFIVSSTLVNTCFSAKSKKTAMSGLVFAAIAVAIIALMPPTIGIVGSILYPDATSTTILYSVAASFGPSYSIIISVAVMAAIFSTGPALLLTLCSTLTQDFYTVIRPDSTMQQRLRFNRMSVIIVGIIATFLGMQAKSILATISGAFQIRSVAAVVLIVGIHWKKVDNLSAFVAMLVGGIVSAIWFFAGNLFGLTPFTSGNIVGIVILVVMSLVRNRGKEMSDDFAEFDAKRKAVPLDQI